MNEYTRKAAEEMKRAFDEFAIEYTTNEDGDIKVERIPLDNNLEEYLVLCTFGTDLLTYTAPLPITVDKPNRQDIAEFIARVNYGLKVGHFDLDMEEGYLWYSTYVDCKGGFNEKTAEYIISACDQMVERYGDGFLDIINGISTPEEAFEECEG